MVRHGPRGGTGQKEKEHNTTTTNWYILSTFFALFNQSDHLDRMVMICRSFSPTVPHQSVPELSGPYSIHPKVTMDQHVYDSYSHEAG